jgi:exopolysaccharide production protein ExoQ
VEAHNESLPIPQISPPGTGEYLFLIALLFLTSSAFSAFLQGDEATTYGARSGTLLTNIIWASMYVVAAIFVMQHCKNFKLSIRRSWIFLAPIGIAIVSLVWSDDRGLTFLRCVALVGTTLQSYYLAVRFNYKRLLRALGWVGFISMVLSYFFALFLPKVGIGTDVFAGDWLGIFPHKNGLGGNATLWFLVFLVLSGNDRENPWAARFGAGASLLLVFLSNSASSIVSCVIILAIFLGRRAFWLPRWALVAIGVGAVGLLNWGLTSESLEAVVNSVGRDPTLTGRTEIWGLVWIMIMDKPILGYGYGAFWRGLEGPSEFVWRSFGMPLFYSHNGFLDVWLDVGVVGLLLFLAGLAICFKKAARMFQASKNAESMWPLLFLILLFVSNLTEGTILRVNLLPWLLYMTIALKLSKAVTFIPSVAPISMQDNRPSLSDGLA